MFTWWYDELDQAMGAHDLAVQYGVYYSTTLVAIVVVACFFSGLAFLAWQQVPSATTAIAARHDQAAQLAREHSDGTPLFRSKFSKMPRPTEDLEESAQKRWQAGVSFQRQLTEAEIRRWVMREDFACRAYWRGRSVLRAFGGTHPIRLSLKQLIRPPAALLAAAIVIVDRPVPGARQIIQDTLGSTSELVDPATLSRTFPIVLFALGVSVAILRSSRILDGIRARDEAAKDANRLLLELCGALLRAHYELYSWTKSLALHRSSIVSDWVRIASNSTYEWDPRGGLREIDRFSYAHRSSDSPLDTSEGSEIESRIDQITQIGRRIDAAGLALVCLRITRPVAPQLAVMGLGSWHRCEPDGLRPWFAAPSVIQGYFDRHADNWTDLSRQPTDDGNGNARDYRLQVLEDKAFRWALQLDLAIARAIRTERDCRTVAIFLNKRVHGSFVTRAASTIQK